MCQLLVPSFTFSHDFSSYTLNKKYYVSTGIQSLYERLICTKYVI